MYNYLPWPSNMRTADQVLSMRIQEGSAGYGVYVMLLELLRDAENRQLVCNPKHLAFAINEPDVSLVERIVQDYGLFNLLEDGKFCSPFLEAQMKEYDAKKAAAVAAGKRGAARRYGKPAEESADGNIDTAGNPMGTLKDTDSNITQHNDINEIKSTRSRLLGMKWRDMTGEDLFSLARKREPLIDEMSRQVINDQQQNYNKRYGEGKFNFLALVDVCDFFQLGARMFKFLSDYTNYGRVGGAPMQRLTKLVSECKKTGFMPKYPAEYLVVKLLEPIQEPTFRITKRAEPEEPNERSL